MSKSRQSKTLRWPFTKRDDGLISVTLDNNCWDFLFENNIDVAQELPKEQFAIYITREIEIETTAIPLNKKSLSDYIRHTVKSAEIQTSSNIGFDTGEIPQRFGTFGEGTFRSSLEAEIFEGLREYCRSEQRPSGLYQNEGDVSLAIASFFSIALTMERSTKKGPLQFARKCGGRILHLCEVQNAAQNMRKNIQEFYASV